MHHPRPWHRGSLFGDGPRAPLDRNQRARVVYLLDAHVRANRLPAKQERAGKALLKRLGEDGRCDPSHRTLAADAGVSESTVERGLNRMRELGLVRWQNRLVRNGWRAEQTSNAYELMPDASAPLPTPVSCDRQSDGETRFVQIQIPEPPAYAVRQAQEALARARVTMEQRLRAKRNSDMR